MKLIIFSAIFFITGFVLQTLNRPPVEDLEYEASVAWNETNLTVAEQMARQALGRNPASVRAQEILNKLAEPLRRPEIELALKLGGQNRHELKEKQFAEAGRIALSGSLFRIANQLLFEGLQQYPRSAVLQHQYSTLPGLQLDAEQMQTRLIQWSKVGTPPKDLVVMFLGLASIDSRAASSAEEWLRASLAADSNDVESRLGLARCLLAMGRYRECIQLLESHCHDPRVATLQAVAYATDRNLEAAQRLLPDSEPATMRAEFWYARGLIYVEQEKWEDAELALRNAVRERPLNKSYRSRQCEILRRLKRTEEEAIQVKHLEKVIRVVQASLNLQQVSDTSELLPLAEMCSEVGAEDIAKLVSAVASH
ncbi:MAG: tetratricopeptide repeat protein [Planctomycetaceae bacterium]